MGVVDVSACQRAGNRARQTRACSRAPYLSQVDCGVLSEQAQMDFNDPPPPDASAFYHGRQELTSGRENVGGHPNGSCGHCADRFFASMFRRIRFRRAVFIGPSQ